MAVIFWFEPLQGCQPHRCFVAHERAAASVAPLRFVRRVFSMRHNFEDHFSWLGGCSAWADVFGARFRTDLLEQKASPVEPLLRCNVVRDWLPVWRRATQGTLQGGDVPSGSDNRPLAVAGSTANCFASCDAGRSADGVSVSGDSARAAAASSRKRRGGPLGSSTTAHVTGGSVSFNGGGVSEPLPKASDTGSGAGPDSPALPAVAPSPEPRWPPEKRSHHEQKLQAGILQNIQVLAYAPAVPNPALLEELRRWRAATLAASNPGRKAFHIFSNKILEDIASTIPTSEETLLSISGVGLAKVEEFGQDVLQLCRRYATSRPLVAGVGPASSSVVMEGGNAPRPPPLKRQRTAGVLLADGAATAPPPAHIASESLTQEQRLAAERALKGECLFITGAAGTGKSFLLRYLIQELSAAHPGLVAVTAPTGLAAVNIGGQTLHSFAGIGVMDDKGKEIRSPERMMLFKIRKSETSVARWVNTKALIIDEISMMDPVLFEQLDFIAREIRGKRRFGFGGPPPRLDAAHPLR